MQQQEGRKPASKSVGPFSKHRAQANRHCHLQAAQTPQLQREQGLLSHKTRPWFSGFKTGETPQGNQACSCLTAHPPGPERYSGESASPRQPAESTAAGTHSPLASVHLVSHLNRDKTVQLSLSLSCLEVTQLLESVGLGTLQPLFLQIHFQPHPLSLLLLGPR